MSKAKRSDPLRVKDLGKLSTFPPEPDREDPYGPQQGSNRTLQCMHCDQIVKEQDMRWTAKPGGDWLWYCPTIGCDGAGLGWDLHEVDPVTHEPVDEHSVH